MADHYVSEQEQVEQLKRWWKENGKSLLAGLVLGVGGLAGYRYWDATQTAIAGNASINYEHFLRVASAERGEEAVAAGRAVVENYPDSIYARLATLVLARIAVENGDLETARANLRALADDPGSGEIATVARARLARIMLAEGDPEGAAAMLATVAPIEGADRYLELRGDVLLARGDAQGAREMYLKALSQADELGLERGALQIKLDNLDRLSGSDS